MEFRGGLDRVHSSNSELGGKYRTPSTVASLPRNYGYRSSIGLFSHGKIYVTSGGDSRSASDVPRESEGHNVHGM